MSLTWDRLKRVDFIRDIKMHIPRKNQPCNLRANKLHTYYNVREIPGNFAIYAFYVTHGRIVRPDRLNIPDDCFPDDVHRISVESRRTVICIVRRESQTERSNPISVSAKRFSFRSRFTGLSPLKWHKLSRSWVSCITVSAGRSAIYAT